MGTVFMSLSLNRVHSICTVSILCDFEAVVAQHSDNKYFV